MLKDLSNGAQFGHSLIYTHSKVLVDLAEEAGPGLAKLMASTKLMILIMILSSYLIIITIMMLIIQFGLPCIAI